METLKLVLEYCKLILSPQVITGVVILIIIKVFVKDIRGLIGRLATIKFPGGELSTNQAEQGKGEPTDRKPPEIPSESVIDIPPTLSLNSEQVTQVRQLFEAERAKAYLWEYRYLNYFLVPHTQRVLDWLASIPQSTSVSFFDSFWQPLIPGAQERRAIISALEQHHLIQLTGELVEITPKGKEYIQWRGPLPAAATPSS